MVDKPAPQQPKKDPPKKRSESKGSVKTEKKLTAAETKAAKKKAEEAKQEIIAETVLGELMQVLIEAPRKMQMGWKSMSEAQQKTVLFEAEVIAKEKIKRIVELIGSTEHKTVRVNIDHAKIKGKFVLAQISFPKHAENREDFIDFIESAGVLTLIDPDVFFGDEGKPVAEPDQIPLNNFE